MKKIVLLFAMVMVAGLISAQTCSKKCTKNKSCAKTAESAAVSVNQGQVASLIAEADALAARDATIERRECSTSGKVSYFQKSVCSTSGAVSNSEVTYCGDSKAFIKVASATMEADASTDGAAAPVKKACSSATKTSCAKTCSKGAKTASIVNVNEGQVASLTAEADALAAGDSSIERKECSTSGKVSYYQKSTCATSGTVSTEEVKYCSDSKAFIKVASATMESDAAPVTKKECSSSKKSCAKKCAAKAAGASKEM